MKPPATRPSIVGAPSPESPYPVRLRGTVTHGFKRGSRDLGFPTANLPDDVSNNEATVLQIGVHYGWASVGRSATVWPMVMSYGWNPTYKNTKKTAEVHIMNVFESDFYGEELRIVVLGFIRPEYEYSSLDALIADIKTDIEVAQRSLERPAYHRFIEDPFVLDKSAQL
ncbi:riboflavin kinase [Gonapodya prolifera JEL478]|uniref:Riboflavin kinase n=1 Tax=Gonapodya prolifera (strain JEL478) TaxID=1344416 RepID=A0A139A678_GONPJ|nr:riboflavin kinase [Gonapodya prolifera JEL478]|eukprot:KXS11883.1 riboflavin kinase [Gonapodya prolifera JEL478]